MNTARTILENPDHFNMAYWIMRSKGGCRTTGCIAGWTVVLNQVGCDRVEAFDRAAAAPCLRMATNLLELTEHQATRLFYLGNWPLKFVIAYENAKTGCERAKACYERIKHFIETDGKE